jgi:hypothetical protein
VVPITTKKLLKGKEMAQNYFYITSDKPEIKSTNNPKSIPKKSIIVSGEDFRTYTPLQVHDAWLTLTDRSTFKASPTKQDEKILTEAELKAIQEAEEEAARLKAEQEAEVEAARLKAEQEAEVEAARLKAEQDAQANLDITTTKEANNDNA